MIELQFRQERAGWKKLPLALVILSMSFGCSTVLGCSGEKLHIAADGGEDALDAEIGDVAEEGAAPIRDAEDFVRVAMEFRSCGGPDNCWRRFEVRAPSDLVLEDLAGEERFGLEDRQYRAVLEVVLLPEFQAVMADPRSWSCPAGNADDPTVSVEWKDAGIQQAQVPDGCFGTPDDPQHLYQILKDRLIYLKKKYMDCPIESILPAEIGSDSTSRALCFACMGDC